MHGKTAQAAISEHVTAYIANKSTEYEDTSAESKYMPLKYYTRKGFPAWRVKQYCRDKKFTNLGGWLYSIDIDKKQFGYRSEKELGDRNEGRVGEEFGHGKTAAISNSGAPNKKEKSVKATAAQAERSITEAGKIMGKLAPAKFALDHVLKQFGIDQMPSFALGPAQQSKAKIDEMHANAKQCLKEGEGLEFDMKGATAEATKATKSVSFFRGLLLARKAHVV